MKRLLLLFVAVTYALSLFSYPGKVVNMFSTPGQFSTGLTFDGKYLWLADRKTDLLYQINPENGKVVRTLKAPAYWIVGLAYDGKNLWAVDLKGGIPKAEAYQGKLYKVDPKDGTILHTVELPVRYPQDLAWDGHYLWVVDAAKKQLVQFDPSDGTTIKSIPAPATRPTGLTYDGRYLWVSDRARNEIYMVEPSTGIVLLITSSPDEYPRGLAWDGQYLWNNDSQSDKIYKLVRKDNDTSVKLHERFAQLTFTHLTTNFGPGKIKTLDVYLAIPVNRINQEIVGDIKFDPQPTDFITDKWGQKVAHYHLTDIPAGQQREETMTVKAKMWDVYYFIFPEDVGTVNDIPKDLKKKYLVNDVKYQYDHPVIQKAVHEAVRDEKNVYWMVRHIFDYLREHMYYEMSGGWNTAPTVLARGNGSCSEYSFVFISMCRAAGVPARYVGSVAERGEAASTDDVFHRWVEVYMPGIGWVPVDPSGGDQKLPADQARYFGHLSRRFLITTQSGGGSKTMEWTYNANEHYTTDPQTNVVVEYFGDWQPLEK